MCITSAMPDMPMPPMPMKWMVPMSVPTPFIPRRRSGIGSILDRREDQLLGGHRIAARIAAGPLDEVGKLARGIRPPHGPRPRRRLGEGLRVEPQFLHLLGELDRREASLRNHPRAARLRHLASIRG